MVSIVGYIGWYPVLARGGIMRIAPLMFLPPISDLVLAALFLDEHLTRALGLGAAAVLAGVALSGRDSGAAVSPRRARRRRPAAPVRTPHGRL